MELTEEQKKSLKKSIKDLNKKIYKIIKETDIKDYDGMNLKINTIIRLKNYKK